MDSYREVPYFLYILATGFADPSHWNREAQAGAWILPSETFANRTLAEEPPWTGSRRVSEGSIRAAADRVAQNSYGVGVSRTQLPGSCSQLSDKHSSLRTTNGQ